MQRFEYKYDVAHALYGTIQLCIDKTSGKKFAIKRIHLKCANERKTIHGSWSVEENIVMELNVNRKFQSIGGHLNIVTFHGEFEENGYMHLIFDYYLDGSLSDILSNSYTRRLDSTTTAAYLVQIANGIQYMHQNGIAHRDICLDNVLVNGLHASICDFGLAIPHMEFQIGAVGKDLYMAPEVACGSEYDPRKADIWSLGIVMYTLLVGSSLVSRADLNDARFHQMSTKGIKKYLESIGTLEIFNDQALDLLTKMLKIDRDSRYSIDEVLKHPFLTQSMPANPWPTKNQLHEESTQCNRPFQQCSLTHMPSSCQLRLAI